MIPLIDTHQHLLYPDLFGYDWVRGVPALSGRFSLEDYAGETIGTGIETSLFMETDVRVADAPREARFFLQHCASDCSALCGVVASIRPEAVDFQQRIDAISSPFLKGVRRILHVVDDSVSRCSAFRKNVGLLGSLNLTFDLCVLPRQHELGLELVDACPQTQFVLNHCGNPNIATPDGFHDWRESIKRFALRPNVTAKFSGLVASSPVRPAPMSLVSPYMDTIIENFTPARCLWGSDWPVCTLTTPLAEWVNLFRLWVGQFCEEEQHQICHRTAREVYKL